MNLHCGSLICHRQSRWFWQGGAVIRGFIGYLLAGCAAVALGSTGAS